MTISRRSARWQGILAGVVTLAVVIVPTAAIVYGAQAGSVGSVSVSGFGGIAVAVLGVIAIATGVVVYRAYRADPNRRPGEVWSTWFSGFVVLVIGSWFVPFLVLFVFVDSDHALSDRMVAVMLVWTTAQVALAGIAGWMMRSLMGPPPPSGPVII